MIGKPVMVDVERERLVLLDRIRRLAQASLMATDDQRTRVRRELEEAIAEHYRRFERNSQLAPSQRRGH